MLTRITRFGDVATGLRRPSPICLALLLFIVASDASAQIGIAPGLRVDRPARSLKAARDQNVVKQRFDFSCGAAALATLLRYGFGDRVGERDVLRQVFESLSNDERATVQRSGFSLLHLQRVAQQRGYNAEGFRLTPDTLGMLAGPVLVFIEPRGYKHFAVLRGVRNGRVQLADPSRGNIRVPLYTFLHDWLQDDGRGIIFVVEPKSGLPAGGTMLLPSAGPAVQPQFLSVRELMAIGGPLTASVPGR